MGEDVLPGDGAGSQAEFPGYLARGARDVRPGLGDQAEDSAGVVVKPPAGGRESDPAALAAKQGGLESGFQLLNPLADGRLTDPEMLGRGRKAAPLGRFGERLQV